MLSALSALLGMLTFAYEAGAQTTPERNHAIPLRPDTDRAIPLRPDTDHAIPLSLEDAISRARNRNEDVLIARAEVGVARSQVRTASALKRPRLDGLVSYVRNQDFPDFLGAPKLPDSLRFRPDLSKSLEQRVRDLEKHASTAGLANLPSFGLPFDEDLNFGWLNANYLLYSGGRVQAEVAAARHGVNRAGFALTEQDAETELQVRATYYTALREQRRVIDVAESLAQAERVVEFVQLRRQAQRASDLEVLRAEVDRENLRPQLVQARNARDTALMNLNRLIDLPLLQPVRLTTELVPPLNQDTASVPEFDPSRRAAVRAAEQQVQVKKEEVRAARSAYRPSLALNTIYSRARLTDDPVDAGTRWQAFWIADLNVGISIFEGGKRRAAVDRARLQHEQAMLQLSSVRRVVELEFQRARLERNRALVEIDARTRNVASAERVYDLTTLRWERQVAVYLDVTDARTKLLQARTDLTDALADYYIADAKMQRAMVGGTSNGPR